MMPDHLIITIPGVPVPQGRPRLNTMRGCVYDPPECKREKQRLKMELIIHMRKNTIPMLEGALSVSILFFIPIPKSFSKKRHAAAHEGRILPTPKPDLDNYAKLVLDAGNGVLYKDDSCVVDAAFSKRYSNDPRVVIEVACHPVNTIVPASAIWLEAIRDIPFRGGGPCPRNPVLEHTPTGTPKPLYYQ